MSESLKVVLVVGSPRGRKSVSDVLAGYMAEHLQGKGVDTKTVYAPRPDLPDVEAANLNVSLDAADQAFFFFPLYADQLPSGLIALLERYARYRSSIKTGRLRSIAALCQSGFPESFQNDQALAVMRRFAELQDLEFLGGLALGGGGMVQGEIPLSKQGGKVTRIAKVLRLSAEAFAEGKPLPAEALDSIRRPVIPAFLYGWIAELGFRWEAHKKKADLRAKPYVGDGLR
jgi:hypothetical protein